MTADAPNPPHATRPTELTAVSELIDDCVHCGFCLPACPTYALWGEEMDSPRGRIDLMRQAVDGTVLSPQVTAHFDACLGCLACVPACPSGVRYDRLIQAVRTDVERDRPTGAAAALRTAIFALFPYPRRLRALRTPLRWYRRSGLSAVVHPVLARIAPALATMEELTPAVGHRTPKLPERVPARGARRATVGLLTGCVQDAFFPQVNTATARVLAMEGCDVVIPPGQGCCGALSAHSGRTDEARRFARRAIEAFEDVDVIVVNSAGCGSAMKEYGELLAGDPSWARRAESLSARVADLTEFLAGLGPRAPRRELPVTVAYHDACHLAHAQGITAAPRALLGAIPGLRMTEVAEGELCCGSAGVYNLVQPTAGRDLGDRKAANVARTGADVLVSANPGCALQITSALRRAGHPMRSAHIAQVLDASLRGVPL